MLDCHLFFTVSVLFIWFSFLFFNLYIEERNLHGKLLLENNLLNIEGYIQFNSFLMKYNRNYEHEEYLTRLQYFRESLEEIARLNRLDPSAKYGITKFSDMSKEEFARRMSLKWGKRVKKYNCNNKNFSTCLNYTNGMEPDDDISYEDTSDERGMQLDWRKKGIIGPVLDQKMCLSCWAVSATGIMEAKLALMRKYRVSLSVQEMLDCESDGCQGGNMINALKRYCNKHYNTTSITAEHNYRPLTMVAGQCYYTHNQLQTRVSGVRLDCNLKDRDIVERLKKGPVAAVINAEPLKSYVSGIVRFSCHRNPKPSNVVDHAVQIVGYNKLNDIPYYIVKNSWGEDFGIYGYVYIAMYNNVCGIADEIVTVNVTYRENNVK